MLRTSLLVALSLLACPEPTAAQDPQTAARRFDAFLDRFPDLGPGYAVVVVTPDEVLLRHTAGVRNAVTGAPMQTDTPIYIASQTKAYVGLLAARLDAEGIFGLDLRIADVWPDLDIPGFDPGAWSMRDLLAHNVPIDNGYVPFMEAYVTELASADYPALLEEHSRLREPGHQYANTGYNIWGALVETATGKSWRTWLDEKLFGPLGLERTSSRTSDFPLDELSFGHIWQGEEEGWFAVRPKTDPLMQSAGGLVTSVDDMGRWLQAHLKGAILEDTGITPRMIDVAHQPAAHLDPDERGALELPCSAYSLGWNVCDFRGHVLYTHGGGYTGARTQMAFSPDLGVGIGVFSNSDNMTGWLTSRTVIQYLQYVVDADDAESMADVRERSYPERIARLLQSRLDERATLRANTHWFGWEWEPEPVELQAYVGSFESDDPYLTADVTLDEGELRLRIGGLTAWLVPARPDLFGAYTAPFSGPDPLEFRRGPNGPSSFEWDGRTYRRTD